MNWTNPYFGVQHYGAFSTTDFWASVSDYGSFATSHVWTPGCGFSPMEADHVDAAAAREYAENQLYMLTHGRKGVKHEQGRAGSRPGLLTQSGQSGSTPECSTTSE